ncbi:MAG TPA: histidine kinase [Blastocatellia bacterium]|nr:histidine kinase [Blastocatellia bacterium]
MFRHHHPLLNHRHRDGEAALPAGSSLDCPCIFGQSVAERWGSRLALIIASTITSLLLEVWIIGRPQPHPLAFCALYSLIYSTCIGLLVLHAISLFSARISRLPFPFNWMLLLLTILVSSTIGCVISGVIVTLLGFHPFDYLPQQIVHSLKISLLLSLIFGTSFYLYENLKNQLEEAALELRTRQLEEERARKLAIAAQLSSLESRVRPHFLFNTLNSISVLTREDPPRAERMVERLSALLRFSLDSNHRNTVLLRDEVRIVSDYLEIEKVRFGERLQFSIEAAPETGTLEVPPFALQTLVENSIKHGLAGKRAGGEIRVRAATRGDQISLEVWDDGPGFSADAIIAGHGLDNLQSRLAVLFADRATFDIRQEDRFTVAAISLPVPAALVNR